MVDDVFGFVDFEDWCGFVFVDVEMVVDGFWGVVGVVLFGCLVC